MARDDWQGVDLTTAFEEVGRKEWERLLADANPPSPTWDDLHPIDKQAFKQTLAPVITDAIDVAVTQWDDQSKGLLNRLLDDLDSTLAEQEAGGLTAVDQLEANRHCISEVKALVADARNDYKEV